MKACDCEDSWRAVWAARSCLKKQNRKETYVPAKKKLTHAGQWGLYSQWHQSRGTQMSSESGWIEVWYVSTEEDRIQGDKESSYGVMT